MKFDWRKFCREERLEYVTSGPNTSKNNINIKCPLCSDHSHHMGLSLNIQRPYWHCWKCNRGGRDPTALVSTLLNVKHAEASRIVREYQSNPDDFDDLFEEDPMTKKEAPGTLELPANCNPITDNRAALRFVEYLARARGFGADALRVAKAYNLHYALAGNCAQRIIYPVYDEGRLVGWTGRAISHTNTRYLSSEGDLMKSTVGNFDGALKSGRWLAITEGPFDMMKLDFYGAPMGVRAVCTFGTSLKLAQIAKLVRLLTTGRLEQGYVVFDKDANGPAWKLSEYLSETTSKRVIAARLEEAEDPGDLSEKQVLEFLSQLIEKRSP